MTDWSISLVQELWCGKIIIGELRLILLLAGFHTLATGKPGNHLRVGGSVDLAASLLTNIRANIRVSKHLQNTGQPCVKLYILYLTHVAI